PEERGQKLVREGEEALNDAKMPMASVLPAAPLQAQQTQEGRVAEEPRAELLLSREPRPVEAAQTQAQPQIQAQALNEPQIQVISSPAKEKDKIHKAAFEASRPFEKEERLAREEGVSLSPWAQLYQRTGFFVGNLFDQLTQIWRRRGEVVSSTPGEAAAAAFRAKARAHQRNRLTPSRLLGWGLWGGTVSLLFAVVIMSPTQVKEVWPRTERVFSWFEKESAFVPLSIEKLGSRYAQSPHGPVLEVKGILMNELQQMVLPTAVLVIETADGIQNQPVTITDEPLPMGGERPFIIRAQLPQGAVKANLIVSTDENIHPQPNRFVLQRHGSGWAEPLSP
ncbi:MAG: hypothetical protein AAF603_09480, partial [Pseudomonadota bacterium]